MALNANTNPAIGSHLANKPTYAIVRKETVGRLAGREIALLISADEDLIRRTIERMRADEQTVVVKVPPNREFVVTFSPFTERVVDYKQWKLGLQ